MGIIFPSVNVVEDENTISRDNGNSVGYPRIKQRWVRFQTRYLSDLDPLDGSPGHLLPYLFNHT